MERSAAAILHWSNWRRWHQAWARYYHYRQRQSAEASCHQPQPQVRQVAEVHNDVIEVLWSRLLPLLPPEKRGGRPYDYSRRLVLEAIVYVMQTDCGWRNLPSGFPPWQTIYAQLTRWRKSGIWGKIWHGLEQPCPYD